MVRRLATCGCVFVLAAMACRRSEPRADVAACRLTRGDTLAIAALARDTIGRLKSRPQAVTLISAVPGGVSIRTEDADSTAFHNGGAVSFDCSKRVTSIWLDTG